MEKISSPPDNIMFSPEKPSWSDRWKEWRNRLVASPRFQAWAADFPMTRWIAGRQAASAFDLCVGFVYTQILTACVRLQLFQALSSSPSTTATLSAQTGIDAPRMERLLRAASALGLVERRSHDRWGLGMAGAAFLANPGAMAMVEHNSALYADLDDPLALLTGHKEQTSLASYWPYAAADRPEALPSTAVSGYSALMSASLPMLMEDVLDAYPFSKHRKIMDVGGGEGTFLAGVAARAPDARLVLFDLPAVAERAKASQGLAAATDRLEIAGGDFSRTPLPPGADLTILVRVLLDHDDATVLALLRNIASATSPGTTLLIAEPVAGTPGAERVADAYFGFYLMAMGRGRVRTLTEHSELLAQAGFDNVRQRRTRRPFLTCLLSAQRCANDARFS